MNVPSFCLTLDKTPARTEAARAEFERAGVPVTFFPGIHGESWGLRTSLPYEVDGIKTPPTYIDPGAVGNILSHWMLWQAVSVMTDIDEFLVFEDDVTLCPNFVEEFETTCHYLPENWDMVYVGHAGTEGHKVLREFNHRLSVIEHPFGTHALLLRRRALSTLLRTQALVAEPIDIQIFLRAHLNYYCCTPSLASQKTVTGEWSSLVNPKRTS
jgi:GR25 family glycosyltransferase involved in LPS biosynthesis